jgi:hypothetical protein
VNLFANISTIYFPHDLIKQHPDRAQKANSNDLSRLRVLCKVTDKSENGENGKKTQFEVFKWLLVALIGGSGYICLSHAAELLVNLAGIALILIAAAIAKYANTDA